MAAATGTYCCQFIYYQPLIVLNADEFKIPHNAGTIAYLTQAGYAIGSYFKSNTSVFDPPEARNRMNTVFMSFSF
jgi:hypothetical protein